MRPDPKSVKVVIKFDPPLTGECRGETLWADDIGHGLYILRNDPLFAVGLHNGDTLRCEAKDNKILVKRVERRGGRTTLVIRFESMLPIEVRREMSAPLRSWDAEHPSGCSWSWMKFETVVLLTSLPREHAQKYKNFVKIRFQGAVIEHPSDDDKNFHPFKVN